MDIMLAETGYSSRGTSWLISTEISPARASRWDPNKFKTTSHVCMDSVTRSHLFDLTQRSTCCISWWIILQLNNRCKSERIPNKGSLRVPTILKTKRIIPRGKWKMRSIFQLKKPSINKNWLVEGIFLPRLFSTWGLWFIEIVYIN